MTETAEILRRLAHCRQSAYVTSGEVCEYFLDRVAELQDALEGHRVSVVAPIPGARYWYSKRYTGTVQNVSGQGVIITCDDGSLHIGNAYTLELEDFDSNAFIRSKMEKL